MELIMVGGAKGTGKSTLLAALQKKHPEYIYLHPGELYWQHFQKKSFEEISDIITEHVLCQQGLILLDTHYAGYFSGKGWQPCWAQKSLSALAESPLVAMVQLYLVEASLEDVLKRREKDQVIKKRRLDRESILAEITLSRTYFEELKQAFQHKLTRSAVIWNDCVKRAVCELEQCITSSAFAK